MEVLAVLHIFGGMIIIAQVVETSRRIQRTPLWYMNLIFSGIMWLYILAVFFPFK